MGSSSSLLSGHVCEGRGWVQGIPQGERVSSPGAEVRQFLFIEIDSVVWLQTGNKLHMIEGHGKKCMYVNVQVRAAVE